MLPAPPRADPGSSAQIDINEFFDVIAEATGFVNRNHLFLWLNANPQLAMEWVQFTRDLCTHFPSWYAAGIGR